MKRIDDHLHVAYDGLNGQAPDGTKFADGAAMKAWMDQHEVIHGIALSGGEYSPAMGIPGSCNIDVCALAHKYPETFSWMCMVDADRPEQLDERLAEYKAMGAVGVGEFAANYWISEEPVQRVFAACERQKMPILFHMSPQKGFNYGICDESGLPQLEAALKKFQDLTVIAHSQPFWYEIGGGMPGDLASRNTYPTGPVRPGGRVPELLRNYPNLYADLSANSAGNAILRDPEFGLKFLTEFQDKLMFGTDMCNPGMEFPLAGFIEKSVAEGKLSEEAAEKIFVKNAIRVLGLKNICAE